MKQKDQLTIRMLRSLALLVLMMLAPQGLWAEDYNIVVGGVRVTSDNASGVTGANITGTVSYDAQSNTLTLNNATITGGIRIWQSPLDIDILGDNSVTAADSSAIQSWVQTYAPTVTFKSTGSTLGKLTLTPASSYQELYGLNVYYDTNVCSVGHNEEGGFPAGGVVVVRKVPEAVIVVPNGIVFTDEDVTIRQSIANDEFDIYYQTKTQRSKQQEAQKFSSDFRLTTGDDGNASVTAYTALITAPTEAFSNIVARTLVVLDRPTFSVESGSYQSSQSVVINGLPTLGTTQGYIEGEDTPQMFPQVRYYFDDDVENATPYSSGSAITIDQPCTLNAYLLAVNDSNVVVRSSVFSATYTVPLAAPQPFLKGDLLGFEYSGDGVHYTIDYVSEDLEETEGTWDYDDETIAILGPCIITAYAVKDGTTSATITAKYFGFANDNEIDVTYGTTQVEMPALIPAIEEEDGITVSKEGNFVDDGKTIINLEGKTIGKASTTIITSLTETDNTPFIILNHYVNLNVNIVPPAPAIAFDDTKTYLDTDYTEIILPETLANFGVNIYYSWNPDCAINNGNNYGQSGVPMTAGMGTKTLYAWVRVNDVYSEKTSQEFTIKSDIDNWAVKDLTTPVTYTGLAITPTFTLWDGKTETNILSDSDYDVIYETIVDQEPEVVSSIVDAGTYIITVQGKGNYGGEKTITREFTVSPVDLSNVTIEDIADQTYTGSAVEPNVAVKLGNVIISSDQYTVEYSNNTDAGEATVTVTFTSGNFTTSEAALVKTKTFTIVHRTLEVTFASGQTWATYYNASESMNLPEGVNAYVVTDVSGASVSLQAISYVPVGKAVLLEQSDTKPSNIAESLTGYNSLLIGTSSATDVSSINGTVYVLYNGAFMKSTSGTIPANKAYLMPDGAMTGNGAPQMLTIDGGTTGIETVHGSELMVNGYYDLNGRKLSGKPTKSGLYIMNGKVVVNGK